MDFLSFKRFISIEVLIFFYYFGAVILPFLLWYLLKWLMRKYQFMQDAGQLHEHIKHSMKHTFWALLTKNQKIKLITVFAAMFLLMQLFWRMLFEFLIAYMQMRDALLGA